MIDKLLNVEYEQNTSNSSGANKAHIGTERDIARQKVITTAVSYSEELKSVSTSKCRGRFLYFRNTC
jgi:hypothetical protein